MRSPLIDEDLLDRRAGCAVRARCPRCAVRVALAGVALAGVALAGVALAGVALAGVALAGVALAGVALAGVALSGSRWPCERRRGRALARY
ncbi:hypothetical protein K1W54_12155 [Micromonospora sp. CPCC 205371]|nr:hypothetical protein [Micromonospora sp. CPCC 205371]